jgi:probable F420-dependent oxidoreductase
MDFGFSIPTRGPMANRHDLKALAQKGEALGYEYLTVSDHIVIPKSFAPVYPYAADGKPTFPNAWLDQPTALAWLAAVTEKARLLTSVMVVPHRAPVHTAKVLATIDHLSEGRLVLGCGAGWMKEEFEALGAEDFDARGDVTDDYIRVFRELWQEAEPHHDSPYASFSNIVFEPKPTNGTIPIWIGGESPRALRRTAELGDGWYPIGGNPSFPCATIAQYRERAQALEAQAEKAGRDPGSIARGYCANWGFKTPPFVLDGGERFICTGSANEIAGDIRDLAAAGVTTMIVNLVRNTVEESFEVMEWFRKEVRAQVEG